MQGKKLPPASPSTGNLAGHKRPDRTGTVKGAWRQSGQWRDRSGHSAAPQICRLLNQYALRALNHLAKLRESFMSETFQTPMTCLETGLKMHFTRRSFLIGAGSSILAGCSTANRERIPYPTAEDLARYPSENGTYPAQGSYPANPRTAPGTCPAISPRCPAHVPRHAGRTVSDTRRRPQQDQSALLPPDRQLHQPGNGRNDHRRHAEPLSLPDPGKRQGAALWGRHWKRRFQVGRKGADRAQAGMAEMDATGGNDSLASRTWRNTGTGCRPASEIRSAPGHSTFSRATATTLYRVHGTAEAWSIGKRRLVRLRPPAQSGHYRSLQPRSRRYEDRRPPEMIRPETT